MKRVHGWEESIDSPSSGSPPAVSHKAGQTVRRRKGTLPGSSVAMKRQTSSHAKARAASASHYQHSQQHDRADDQAYSVNRVWPYDVEYAVPYEEDLYTTSQAQYMPYAPQFSQSQDYYVRGHQNSF